MVHYLLENKKGGKAVYETAFSVKETEGAYVFSFVAEHSAAYCPYAGNNEDLWLGDVCEVFIGDEGDPDHYYEIEIAPNGASFFGWVHNPNGNFSVTFPPDDGFSYRVEKGDGSYKVEIVLSKERIDWPLENILFNAFRLETDGGVPEKHLFALNPTLCPTFHRPEAFVRLKEYL